MNDHELQAIIDQVGRAIEVEEANAADLMRTVEQFDGLPVADHLRTRAREHRVHGLQLQARLAGLVSAIRTTRG
ncbi:hypothetical protein ASG32_30660 [Methylobacterium sp. Leaf361]|nr:hypothetical protein ASG32_30660 [Methylobacterium sp. Leaf361]